MWEKNYKDCIAYINAYWQKIIFAPKRTRIFYRTIDIPHAFFVPNEHKFNTIFYWDSYFMFKGLMGTKRDYLLKDMVENFAYLFKKYSVIPNFNAPASMGRSQPPFFTSMILDVYHNQLHTKRAMNIVQKALHRAYKETFQLEWLTSMLNTAKKEYESVWKDKTGKFNHHVEGFLLSRYGDRDVGYAHSSELESGWDFTSRFYNRCNHFLPIDLNSYLYKYEKDFAAAAHLVGNEKDKRHWEYEAEKRREEIQRLMWNDADGFFYDYGHAYNRQSDFLSLAGFTPLWAGVASEKQAKRMVMKLKTFETPHGLVITAKKSLATHIDLSHVPDRFRLALEDVLKPKQWDYPNSWPPLEYLTVVGLLQYGFVDDACRLMEKYIKTHAAIFRKQGTFFERINGVTGDKPDKDFHYKTQSGFGWTNAIFFRFIKLLENIDAGEELYELPKPDEPPYKLAVLH